MKPEEEAALKTGGTTAVLAGAVAFCIGNPVCWAAVAYGAYRMGKLAYRHVKSQQDLGSSQGDRDLFI
jgi:NAD(P)H-hydrate repair Nnr-like enzyme with NAD(P)H-hydrate dehydratase domain